MHLQVGIEPDIRPRLGCGSNDVLIDRPFAGKCFLDAGEVRRRGHTRKAIAQSIKIQHGRTVRRRVLPEMEQNILLHACIIDIPTLMARNAKNDRGKVDLAKPKGWSEHSLDKGLLCLPLHDDLDPRQWESSAT